MNKNKKMQGIKNSFDNADVIQGGNKYLQELNINKWIEFLKRNYTGDFINNGILANHRREDRPEKIMGHIRWLEKVGFKDIDVIWKYYNFAVYGGIKK